MTFLMEALHMIISAYVTRGMLGAQMEPVFLEPDPGQTPASIRFDPGIWSGIAGPVHAECMELPLR